MANALIEPSGFYFGVPLIDWVIPGYELKAEPDSFLTAIDSAGAEFFVGTSEGGVTLMTPIEIDGAGRRIAAMERRFELPLPKTWPANP